MTFASRKNRIAIPSVSALVILTSLGCVMAQAKPVLKKIAFSQMAGWSTADKTSSLQAFVHSCAQMKKDDRAFVKKPKFGGSYSDWRSVCRLSEKLGKNADTAMITKFFQENFTPFRVVDPNRPEGLFTGYFEPVVEGSLSQSPQYQIPVYKRPDDLMAFSKKQEKKYGLRYGRLADGKPAAYFTRKKIEQGALKGKGLELVWLKSLADAFFMQVQGSGRVKLPDGSVIRLAYAGKTGLPYTAIGAVLIKGGELTKQNVSMQSIRHWITKNPSRAQSLMWNNQSFVFFRHLPTTDPALGPVGAQQVNLTPQVSLAVDRRYWSLGLPVWLDTEIVFNKTKTPQTWRSLMVAQDTGSAIRGFARGDVFWGSGEKAGAIAGKMKAAGKMVVFLPNALAKKLVD